MGCVHNTGTKTIHSFSSQKRSKLASKYINSQLTAAKKRSSYQIIISSNKDTTEKIAKYIFKELLIEITEEIPKDIIEGIFPNGKANNES